MSSGVTSISEPVARAIAALRASFEVAFELTGDGGAVVTVHELEIGERWRPSVIDLTFEIAFNYPFAAIYPYFGPSGVVRVDGAGEPALQQVEWRGAARTQISLRANRWNPQIDTAAGAVLQVQDWFQRR